MARIVITGAAGFIGSHLAETLLDRGHSVVGIDNLLTGDTANIAHLANRDFTFIKHDVTNYIYIEGPVDFVLHWASPASPIDYLELPIPTLKVGALGTHKALGLAKAKNAKFLIASTSEVYGDPLEHPQRETYWGNVNPIGPRGVYDEAKRFAEAMTVAYHRYHGVDAKIVRIFNTYGPRMRVNDGRAVPAFMSQALRNEDVTIFGDGSQTRSFCYVSDLVEGIIKLMHSNTNDPVNIGNPHEMTIEEIAKTIVRMTGSSSKLVYRPLPTDDPKVRQPDITRARTMLGWEPKVTLEQGLTSTIAYFRQKLGVVAPASRLDADLFGLFSSETGRVDRVVERGRDRQRQRHVREQPHRPGEAGLPKHIHEETHHARDEERRGGDLPEHRRAERAAPDRQVHDRDGGDDADVAAEDEHGQPHRQARDEMLERQREHDEHRRDQQLVGHRIEPRAQRGLPSHAAREQAIQRIGEAATMKTESAGPM